MAKVLSAIKDVVSNNLKHSHSSSPSTNASDTQSIQEKLDTNNLAKILIIGETGSGKSTYINYLTNYFRKGTLENPKVAIPSKYHSHTTENFSHHENDIQNTTKSKTDSCNQYTFAYNSKQYLFLDTPGLADTRGAEQDDNNILSIINAVEGLGGLTTVIIVVNGAVCRLTVNLRNVIARLRGNLPDVVMDNVILVLTNTTRHAANFDISSFALNGNVYPYYMQNSAFSQDPSTWTTVARESLQYEWEQAMDEIAAMLKTIDTFKVKSVSAFKTMKDIRNQIKTLMHSARLEVSQIQKLQDEIAACETAMQHVDKKLVKFKDYKKSRVVEKKEILDAPYHSTLCQHCSYVCHEKCALTESTTAGDQIFQRCWAIKNDHCTQCPNKCSYTAHYHAKKTMKTTQEKLEDVLADIKAKYDMASKDKSDYQNKITTTSDAKVLLQKALNQKKEDIKQLCNELHQLCSGFNMAQELHALIDQLEAEATMLKNIDAKTQAAEFIRSLKEFCSMVEKDQDTIHMRLPKMNTIDTERPRQGQVRQPPTTFSPVESSQTTVKPSPLQRTASSHADENVLAQLRKIEQKKAKKNKSKSKESSSENSEASSEEDESDEEPKEKQKSKKKKHEIATTVLSTVSKTIDAEQLKEFTVDELLTRYRSCADQRTQNFYIYELTQRSHGKSAGPLKTLANMTDTAAANQKYCGLSYNALKQEYEKLKQRITTITEPDVLKIDQVSASLLVEIAVVYQLMSRTSVEGGQSSYINTQAVTEPQQTTPISSHHQHFDTLPPSYHPPDSVRPINMHQNLPTDEQQQHFRPSLHIPHNQHYPGMQQHQCQYTPPHSYTTHSQQSFHPIRSPVPAHQQVPSADIEKELQQMHINPVKYDPRYCSSEHSISSQATDSGTSSAFISYRSTPIDSTIKDDNNQNIRKMTNVLLLSGYREAYTRQHHEQSHILYNELKRRCYGDHPLLIKEKGEVFQNICRTHQNQSLTELKQAYSNVLQTIRDHLIDDDATHLNNIPSDLIVQAGAIAHVMSTKTS